MRVEYKNCTQEQKNVIGASLCTGRNTLNAAVDEGNPLYDEGLLKKLIQEYFPGVSEEQIKEVIANLKAVKEGLDNSAVDPGQGGKVLEITCHSTSDGKNFAYVNTKPGIRKSQRFDTVININPEFFEDRCKEGRPFILIHEFTHRFAYVWDTGYWTEKAGLRIWVTRKGQIVLPDKYNPDDFIDSGSPYEYLLQELWLRLKQRASGQPSRR